MRIIIFALIFLLNTQGVALAMSCILADRDPLTKYEYAKKIDIFFVGDAYAPIIAPTPSFPKTESLLGQKIKNIKALKGLPENIIQIDLYYGQNFSKNSWKKPETQKLYTAYYDQRRNRYAITDIHYCYNIIDFAKEDMIDYLVSGQFERDKFFEISKFFLLSIGALFVFLALLLNVKKYFMQRETKA